MIGRLMEIFNVIIVTFHIGNTDSTNNTNVTDEVPNYAFKDYIQKFNPSVVWRDIDEKNKRNGIKKTFVEELDNIINRIDQTDELLSLKVKNGEPKVILQKDGRRWKPPGEIIAKDYHDPYSVRQRLMELMKQAIYQARTKMVIMQIYREKYNMISLYKMGFLFSRTDTMCKIFYGFAYKAFRSCSQAREHANKYHPLLDHIKAHERLLSRWFEMDLLIDLIVANHRNCERMLNQVLTNRKHAWKFID